MTRHQAIRAKCKDCIYDECAPGTWIKQVSDCTSTDCALWPFRPVSSAPDYAEAKESALKARSEPIAAFLGA